MPSPAVGAKMAAEVGGALNVAVGRVEFHAGKFLEMGRLSVDEELVDCGNFHVADEAEVDAHSQAGKQVHRFFAADRLGRAEDAVRAAHAVVECFLAFADEEIAGLAFVIDEDGHNVAHLLREVFFTLAKRYLVADLVKIALRLRAFAIKTADGEIDFLQAAEDLVDLPRDDEGRQMEHDTAAQAGADVRGAGSKVAETVVVGVGDAGLDEVIEFVGLFPSGGEVEAALENLDAQMVLFVDHHAGLFALVDEDGAGPFGIRMFAADELTFDEELAVDCFQGTYVDVDELAGEFALSVKFFDAAAKYLADLGTVGVGRARDEGEVGQIAGEPNAATDDDIRFWAGTAQPFAAGLSEFLKVKA